MIFDPSTLDRQALHALINGLVYPRPIAWVSTVSTEGRPNLAPFSFFNAFSFFPPTVALGPGSRKGVNKDTLRNIRETGEFTISVVTEELAHLANATSGEFPPEVNEWEAFGIAGAECETVRPRRVAASPAAFECRLLQIIDLGTPDMPTNSLVVGRVVRLYVAEAMMNGTTPNSDALKLVGRMGGSEWCRTDAKFNLKRPASADPSEVKRAIDES